MAEDKKIKFSAVDNGISSFMKKMQADAKSLYTDLTKEAQKQSNSQKEQLKIIESQIKALKEQNKLEKEQNQIILERKRAAGVIDKREFSAGLKEIRNDSRVNQHQTNLLQQMLNEVKGNSKEEKEEKKSVYNAVMMANLVRDLFSGLRTMGNANTQLDLLTPFASFGGGAAGGVTGAAIDLLPFVESSMAPTLATIGKEIGAFVGEGLTRSIRLKEQFSTATLGYRAFTGSSVTVPNLASMGYDDIATAQAMRRIAGARGGSGTGVGTMFGLSRGFGIEEGASLGAFGAERFGGGNGNTNMRRGLGIAIAEGLNRSRLTDVIVTQTALIQQFAQSKTNVSSTDVNRTLFEFNRMGGMFSIGDPRSLSNISGINQNLANPGSPFGQALNYSVLRRLNPNADVFDLMKMQEQGLQTPGFLSGVMGDVTSMGGSSTFQKMMLKSRLPSLSFEAIDTLFNNKGALGSMSQKDLSKMLSEGSIRSEADTLTPRLLRDQAEISNAFRDNFIEGIATLRSKFETEMGLAATEVARILRAEFGLSDEGMRKTVPRVKGATTPSFKGGMMKMNETDSTTTYINPQLHGLSGGIKLPGQ